VVGESDRARLRELVRRRAGREPAQHILGHAGFYGLDLLADRRAMIPRRETELLVDRAIELARASRPAGQARVLDVGCGTGCIALAVAKAMGESAAVTALDVSAEAVSLARENALRLGLDGGIEFLEGDLFSALGDIAGGTEPFDVVSANLPYIPTGEIDTLMPEVRDHDPHVALDGGPDGLDVIRRFVKDAPAWLAPGGWVLIEVGAGQAKAVAGLVADAGLEPGPVLKDPGGIERLVQGRRR